jgi:hypothetical protein
MQLAKQEIDEAFERTDRLFRLKQTGGFIVFCLGEELKIVKDEYESNPQRASELYQFENFLQYCAQPGLAYSITSVNRFIRLHQKYVLELGIAKEDPNLKSIDYTILDSMSRFVDKDNVNDWLRRAASMGRRDLALTVKNEGKEEDCYHVAYDSYEVKICKSCGEEISRHKL